MAMFDAERLWSTCLFLVFWSVCSFGALWRFWFVPLTTLLFSLAAAWGAHRLKSTNHLESIKSPLYVLYYSSFAVLLLQAVGITLVLIRTVQDARKEYDQTPVILHSFFSSVSLILLMALTYGTHEYARSFLEEIDADSKVAACALSEGATKRDLMEALLDKHKQQPPPQELMI